MVAYALVAIIVYLFSFVDLIKLDPVNKKALLLGLFLLLLFFLGTRTVGPDFDTYKIFYNTTPSIIPLLLSFAKYSAETLFEPGFLFLIGICKSLHIGFNGFNLLCSFIILFVFLKGTLKLSSAVFISMLVYLAYGYIYAFSVIRQVIAASIFFYALQYLVDGKIKKYALYILLACMFHFSAVILFVFCFINNKRVNSKIIILIITSLVIAVYTNVLTSLGQKVLFLVPFFSEKKINQYLEEEGSFLGSVSVVWIIILLICLLYRGKFEKLESRFNLYLNIIWIGLAVYAFSVGFGGFGRVLLYFKLAYCLILPLFVFIIKEKSGKFLCVILIGIMSLALYFAAILTDTRYVDKNRYLPYKSWIFESKE